MVSGAFPVTETEGGSCRGLGSQDNRLLSMMCAYLCPDGNEGRGEDHPISQTAGARTMCAGRRCTGRLPRKTVRMLFAEQSRLSVFLTRNVRPIAKVKGECLKRCLSEQERITEACCAALKQAPEPSLALHALYPACVFSQN